MHLLITILCCLLAIAVSAPCVGEKPVSTNEYMEFVCNEVLGWIPQLVNRCPKESPPNDDPRLFTHCSIDEWVRVIDCRDNDLCTADSCKKENGCVFHAGEPTLHISDEELLSRCTHEPVNCDDQDEKTDDSCSSWSGQCEHLPKEGPMPEAEEIPKLTPHEYCALMHEVSKKENMMALFVFEFVYLLMGVWMLNPNLIMFAVFGAGVYYLAWFRCYCYPYADVVQTVLAVVGVVTGPLVLLYTIFFKPTVQKVDKVE
jgi:hypothetical protein